MMIRFLVVLAWAGISQGFAQEISPAIEKLGQQGLDEIYRMDFQSAEKDFRQLLDQSGGHPLGYFGLAGAAWTKLTYGVQEVDPSLEADFWKQADEAISKTRAWVKAHPKDANAFLALGGSYGLRSRLFVFKKQFLSAAMEGRRALKAMRQAHQLNPSLDDAYVGIGTWEYFADVLPRFVKLLSRLFLGGDREAGIRHLRLASEKAKYVDVTATLILIEIYLTDRYGAKNPKEALSLIRGLRRRYPDSPLFHQVEQTSLYSAKDFEGLEKSSREYEHNILSGKALYAGNHMPHVCVPLGTMRLSQGDLQLAKNEFSRCVNFLGTEKSPNPMGLWNLFRLAQTEDALGEKQEAFSHYRQVFSFPDLGFRSQAGVCLKRPCKFDLSHLELLPP